MGYSPNLDRYWCKCRPGQWHTNDDNYPNYQRYHPDDDFNVLAGQTVSTTTTDGDTAGFAVAESSGSTGVAEMGSADTFTVVLDVQPASDVVISVTSADTGEATVTSSLIFTSANWDTAQIPLRIGIRPKP